MKRKGERKSVTISARTVGQAIEKGLAELGISEDEAEIVVVKEGSRGLLGLGAEEAVVTISVAGAPPAPEAPVRERVKREQPKPLSRVEAPKTGSATQVAAPAKTGDLTQTAKEVLEALLDHMGIAGRVELADQAPQTEMGEDAVALNVAGDDLGLLIGRRGETLRDLQFLVRLIVSRRVQKWPNVVVDVEYYKARREKLLMDLARRMAEKVRLSGEPVTLEPMPPHERRIIHLTLRDYPGVFTESTGEGQGRKVMILPKR